MAHGLGIMFFRGTEMAHFLESQQATPGSGIAREEEITDFA
jgi:hypothetical protein